MEGTVGELSKLVLSYTALGERAGQFYQELASSDALRDVFIKDPIGTVVTFFAPAHAKMDHYVISAYNMLAFALLTNEQFMNWAKEYGELARKELIAENPKATATEKISFCCHVILDQKYFKIQAKL